MGILDTPLAWRFNLTWYFYFLFACIYNNINVLCILFLTEKLLLLFNIVTRVKKNLLHTTILQINRGVIFCYIMSFSQPLFDLILTHIPTAWIFVMERVFTASGRALINQYILNLFNFCSHHIWHFLPNYDQTCL